MTPERTLEEEFERRFDAAPDKVRFLREWIGWWACRCPGCAASLDGGNKPWNCTCGLQRSPESDAEHFRKERDVAIAELEAWKRPQAAHLLRLIEQRDEARTLVEGMAPALAAAGFLTSERMLREVIARWDAEKAGNR